MMFSEVKISASLPPIGIPGGPSGVVRAGVVRGGEDAVKLGGVLFLLSVPCEPGDASLFEDVTNGVVS